MKAMAVAMMALALAGSAFGETKALPKIEMKGGMPLFEALGKRQSNRDYTAGAVLTEAELGGVLWAANGFNRADRRTAPSALNAQAVDIYVFDAKGIWAYLPKEHALKLVKEGDFRAATGMQPFVKDAAVNLVFAYDTDRAPRKGESRWAAVDAAFCCENVYLYCAATGLKTVVRASVDGARCAELIGLSKSAVITLAQCVGK